MSLLAAEASDLTLVAIALIGSGGLAGGIIAFLKLGSDKSSAAVSQAQGAMETMQQLNADLIADRDYWRDEARARQKLLDEARRELQEIRQNVIDHEDRWGNGPPVAGP